MKMKTTLRIVLLLVTSVLLMACDGEPTLTPTVSVLPSPTVSPLALPVAQNRLKQTEPISMEDDMTAESLVALGATALSLLFAYVPGAQGWYDALESTKKRLVMAVGLLVIAGTAFGLSCAQVVDVMACTQTGAIEFAKLYFMALGINQGVHWARPK